MKENIKSRTRNLIIIELLMTGLPCIAMAQTDTTYKIVDTGQIKCYNNSTEITPPSQGEPFYGQDANYTGNTPSYSNNGDSTVTDLVTGLMWQKSPDRNGDGVINYSDKLYYQQALDSAASCSLAGYTDWRLPTIKELYSIIMFYGTEPSPDAPSPEGYIPFIDTSYFDFGYGDLSAGERIIDAQYASSTIYLGTTMGGNKTMFGVNFADGRIKGYPADLIIGKKYYVQYVRGNTAYGTNEFVDNSDGTITDSATGLMWMKNDNGEGILWENALSYAEGLEYASYTDWRLPNAKELQSIVDYTRSPDSTNSAAIDSLFNCTPITNEAGETDYPYYWSSTTHSSLLPTNGAWAAYISFGKAMGYMPQHGGWIDVHGAGAQRSDPKSGDPGDWPHGHGPQGDAVRIYNYVRCVRGGLSTSIDIDDPSGEVPMKSTLHQNYPNPFNLYTIIPYQLSDAGKVQLKVYNLLGQEVKTLVNEFKSAGLHLVVWNGTNNLGKEVSSGIYLHKLQIGDGVEAKKMILIK